MKRTLRITAFIFAAALLVMTFVNASWLAPAPTGRLKVIAHRGAYQLYHHAGLGRDTCTASRIEPPVHEFLENTTPSLRMAKLLGAAMVELDVAPTKDGQIAVFHDWALDCRTNGKGEVRDATLAELKKLDAGYGYTADGGKTFPFRGKGVGLIPSLQEFLREPGKEPLIYNFKSRDPHEADLLAAALAAAGRDPVKAGDAFYGTSERGPVARIRRIYPHAWAFSREGATACSKAYAIEGWLGITPEECRGNTLIVPLDRQWAFAGWPNRTQARMKEVGAQVLMVGPRGDGPGPMGLDDPEQLADVPSSFTGWLWVDDIWTVGPAMFPARDHRSAEQQRRADEGLARRRGMS